MCQVTMVVMSGSSTIASFQAMNFDVASGTLEGPAVSHHRSVGAAIADFAQLARNDRAATADLYPAAVARPEDPPFRHLRVSADGDVIREVV